MITRIIDSTIRITINYLNGSLMIRKDIVSNKNPSLKKNFRGKKKESWPSMPECLRKSWRPELERK